MTFPEWASITADVSLIVASIAIVVYCVFGTAKLRRITNDLQGELDRVEGNR